MPRISMLSRGGRTIASLSARHHEQPLGHRQVDPSMSLRQRNMELSVALSINGSHRSLSCEHFLCGAPYA